MKKWILTAIAALIVASGAWYWASPALAMSGLRDALKEGDRDELAERVDFPAVRESLKAQMLVHMQAEMAEQKDNPFAGFGMALATAFINPMIDGMVTPDGIRALVQQGKFKKPGESAPQSSAGQETEWTITRDGMDRFRATAAAADRSGSLAMVFRRDGLGWTLVDIELPTALGAVTAEDGGAK